VTPGCCGTGPVAGCDRWDSLEYFIVREWQERGVLHVHALLRVDRAEAPPSTVLGEAARTAVAASGISGELVGWESQWDCQAFRADDEGARTIWYLSRRSYVMKDTAKAAPEGDTRAWRHLAAVSGAARRMRCS